MSYTDPKAELVIKAQIHAGGRGKGVFKDGFKGGVKVCNKPAEIKEFAKRFLNNTLITKQTGPEGQLCQKVLPGLCRKSVVQPVSWLTCSRSRVWCGSGARARGY